MLITNICRIVGVLLWCLNAAALTVTAPCLAQELDSSWKSIQRPSGATEISARSEIVAPHGAGFATLKILQRASGKPRVIVYLIIESPKRVPSFPFDKYDGPVDKTAKQFIKFEVAPKKQGTTSSVKIMPNGYYGVEPPDAFVFDTIDKSVVSFLTRLRDGQILKVIVNGSPSSLQVAFDATGLNKLLNQK